jgi:hypothetical protein
MSTRQEGSCHTYVRRHLTSMPLFHLERSLCNKKAVSGCLPFACAKPRSHPAEAGLSWRELAPKPQSPSPPVLFAEFNDEVLCLRPAKKGFTGVRSCVSPAAPSRRYNTLVWSAGRRAFRYPIIKRTASSRLRTTMLPISITGGSNVYSDIAVTTPHRSVGCTFVRPPQASLDMGDEVQKRLPRAICATCRGHDTFSTRAAIVCERLGRSDLGSLRRCASSQSQLQAWGHDARSPPTRQNLLATHGRTISAGHL